MRYFVSAADLSRLRLGAPDTVEGVLQNIALILATPKGSVPLHREFGLDWSCLDKPLPAAEVLMRAPVREAIERWEPRATVKGIRFAADPARPGLAIPTVEVEIDLE